MIKDYPNLLLVSGTGRNTGKTTLICSILKKFSSGNKIIAIKITPHFHNVNPDFIIEKNEKYIISEENNLDSGKDTSLMLINGAHKVYFLQVIDDFLEQAIKNLLKHLNKSSLIICESARLRNVVKPGVFILLNSKSEIVKNKDLINFADKVDTIENIETIIDSLTLKDNSWQLKSH